MSDLITVNIESMTSLEIAELTGKRHDNILRDLRKLEIEGVLGLSKFEETEKDSQNKLRTVYHLPKRETLILTSGYSAKQRAQIIDRWLELENSPKTITELLVTSAVQLLKVEQAQERQAQQIAEIEERLENMDGDTGYQTVLAWCRVNDRTLSLKDANRLGRKCSSYCKKAEITMGSIPDERWGSVNSYPVEVLNEVFSKF